MTHPAVRLFYVDDSGAEATGWAVYSWVECTVANWNAGLHDWLELRHALHVRHGISTRYELHASNFLGGRGNPSSDPAWNRKKHLRGHVAEEALAAIGGSDHLSVGAVFRRSDGRRQSFRRSMTGLYAALVNHVDVRLGACDERGLIVMDGNGTDDSYYGPHRDLTLDTRHVIEDPLFQDSRRSQWIQMADLVAYTAYVHLSRPPGKPFAWDWYDRYLRHGDVNGGPVEL